jgi:membrane-bound lytic murein transglycosylase D
MRLFIIFILTFLLGSLGRIAFAQDASSCDPKPYAPFTWMDSLSGLWTVQNSILNLPFKPATQADSRRNMSISLDAQSIKRALDTLVKGHPLPYHPMVDCYINMLCFDKRAGTETMIGYAGMHQAFIDTMVRNYGLPLYFRHLPSAGSNHYYRGISSTGASGPWLLPYLTARRYGLRVDSYVDERRNINLSTQAAFRMLSDMHEIYGDWFLALGAYYCGPANVNKAIRRAGGKPGYWDIYPFLPEPERDFIPALIATAFVAEYHTQLGLVPLQIIWPGVPDTVMVKNQVSLQDASRTLSLPLKLLQELNPEYRLDLIPGAAGILPLRLPEGQVENYLAHLAYIDSLKTAIDTSMRIEVGEPGPVIVQSNPDPTPQVINKEVPVYYTVKSGDNLGMIADWFDVKVSEVKHWNKLRSDVIRAGQKLVIYVPGQHESYYLKINKLTLAQKRSLRGPGRSSTAGSVTASSPPESRTSKYTTYTVRQGDNPTSIASKFPGVTAAEILKANGITDPRRLYVGQKLKIPLKS